MQTCAVQIHVCAPICFGTNLYVCSIYTRRLFPLTKQTPHPKNKQKQNHQNKHHTHKTNKTTLSKEVSLLGHPSTSCHGNVLKRFATHCNALQRTATHCNALQRAAPHCTVLQHTATYCNVLHRTTAQCTALQQPVTHENK